MFQYIKGNLEFIGEDYIVIDNHDIGYKIYTSYLSISEFKAKNEKVKVYTQIIIRDEDVTIYGFSTREELKMFQLLMTVTSVGAKVALGILSSVPLGRLIGVILSEDIQGLTKAQGVGKKTAQRIILELKDKVDPNMAVFELSFIPTPQLARDDADEAVDALVALGYGKTEALKAVTEAKAASINVEDMIKKALKLLVK
ncbi:Holliday junction branch migration protein RuvA [Clostridiaceae bacterium 35-E11]